MFRSPTVRVAPAGTPRRPSCWRPPLLPRRRAPGARLPRLVLRGRPLGSADWPQGTVDPAPGTQSAGSRAWPGSRSRVPRRVQRRGRAEGDNDGGGVTGVATVTRALITASRTTSRSRSRWAGKPHSRMVAEQQQASLTASSMCRERSSPETAGGSHDPLVTRATLTQSIHCSHYSSHSFTRPNEGI